MKIFFLVGRWQEHSRQRKKKNESRVLCYVWPSLLCLCKQEISVCSKRYAFVEFLCDVFICWIGAYLIYCPCGQIYPLQMKIPVLSKWIIGAYLYEVEVSLFVVSRLLFSLVCPRGALESRGREKNYWSGTARRGEPRRRLSCDSWKRVWSSCILVEHQPVSKPVLAVVSGVCF